MTPWCGASCVRTVLVLLVNTQMRRALEQHARGLISSPSGLANASTFQRAFLGHGNKYGKQAARVDYIVCV